MHQRAHPVLPFIPVDRYLGPIFISTFTPTDETPRAVGRKRKAGRLEGWKAGKLESWNLRSTFSTPTIIGM